MRIRCPLTAALGPLRYRVRYLRSFQCAPQFAGPGGKRHCDGTPITDGRLQVRLESAGSPRPTGAMEPSRWDHSSAGREFRRRLRAGLSRLSGTGAASTSRRSARVRISARCPAAASAPMPGSSSATLAASSGMPAASHRPRQLLAPMPGASCTDPGSLFTDAGGLFTDSGSLRPSRQTRITTRISGRPRIKFPSPQQCAGCGLKAVNGLAASR